MERERKIKRAKEREKNEGSALPQSPLVFFLLFRSLSFSLARHYLNAWNGLASRQKWEIWVHFFSPFPAPPTASPFTPATQATIFITTSTITTIDDHHYLHYHFHHHHPMFGSRKYPYPPLGWSLEILRGGGLKGQIF